MGILRQLLLVEAAALAALLVVAGAMAAYGAADSSFNANSLLSPTASAQIAFGYTVILGLLPALLIGAPSYVALLQHNLARWPYVLLLGILPGLVVLIIEITLGFWIIVCGATVALITHFIYHQFGLKNLYKMNPLRGSA